MRPLLALVAGAALGGCGPAYYGGAPDLARTERGEIYVDIVHHGDTYLVHGVEALDVPEWRAWNLMTDVEGYPEWSTLISSIRVVRRAGRSVDAEFVPRALLGHDLAPVSERLTFEPEKFSCAMVTFENDWLRSLQFVGRIEALPGDRTLLTLYVELDLKPWWSRFAVRSAERQVAQTMENVRRAAQLPRYAKREAALPATPEGRVAVPRFTAEGVPPELARAATRALAEGLMRAHWSVITQEEAVAFLDYAKEQQLAGCAGGECELDVARALDAGRLAHGTVSRLGAGFVYSAALLELPDGRVVRRVGGAAPSEALLLEAIRAGAAELSAP